jgi:hypothetical protein
MQVAIELFADVIREAMPYAIVFALGQRIVTLFLGMAFRGDVRL